MSYYREALTFENWKIKAAIGLCAPITIQDPYGFRNSQGQWLGFILSPVKNG